MAIDNQRKRQSVVSVARHWRPSVLVPDGSFNNLDRAAIAKSYGGVTIPSPSALISTYIPTFRRRRR